MALEVLRITDAHIPATTYDMMVVISSTLREMYICEPANPPANQTGTLMLRHWFAGWLTSANGITIAHIRHPLFENRIAAGSFSSAAQLGVLNLSGCQIETIAATAFDGLHALMELTLDDNRLQTIADGVFDNILPNYHLYVQMSRNPWRCDCDICYIRRITQVYWNNFERYETICAVSSSTREPMGPYCEMECGRDMNATSTTTPSMPQITYPDEGVTPNETAPHLFVSQQCESDQFPLFVEVVKITARTRAMRIHDNNDGTVNVTVRLRPGDWQTTLLWFDNSDKHFQSVLPPAPAQQQRDDCVDGIRVPRSLSDSTTTVVHTLTVDIRPLVPYTFCVMANISEQFAVSPFNCMSFTKNDYDLNSEYVHPWFRDETRGFTIAMLTVGVVMCVILGVALGYFMLRKCACCRRMVFCNNGRRRESAGNM